MDFSSPPLCVTPGAAVPFEAIYSAMEKFACFSAKLSNTLWQKVTDGRDLEVQVTNSDKTAPHVALRINGSKNKNSQGNWKQMLSRPWKTKSNESEIYGINCGLDNREQAIVFPKAKEELFSSPRQRKHRSSPISGTSVQSGYLMSLFCLQENNSSCSTIFKGHDLNN